MEKGWETKPCPTPRDSTWSCRACSFSCYGSFLSSFPLMGQSVLFYLWHLPVIQQSFANWEDHLNSFFSTEPQSLELFLCGWYSPGRGGELLPAEPGCALWRSCRLVDTRLPRIVGVCKWPAHSRGVSFLPGAPTGACGAVLGESTVALLSLGHFFQAWQVTIMWDCPSTAGYLPSLIPRIYLDTKNVSHIFRTCTHTPHFENQSIRETLRRNKEMKAIYTATRIHC